MRRLFCTVMLAAMLAGCSEPRLDASSDATMKASLSEVRESLTPEKRAAFDNALKVMLAGMTMNALGSVFTKPMSEDDIKNQLKTELDGKTADQVIARADVIKADFQAKQKAAK